MKRTRNLDYFRSSRSLHPSILNISTTKYWILDTGLLLGIYLYAAANLETFSRLLGLDPVASTPPTACSTRSRDCRTRIQPACRIHHYII
jgi:hypothetical protein